MPGKPPGTHTITPHITVSNAAKAIDFYKTAFGAEELGRSPTPDGRLMHAALRIGDSNLMLNDAFPEMGGCNAPAGGKQPFALHLYWDDVDKAWGRAVNAGAKVTMPLSNMFWGDRYGQLEDPFGITWSMASRVEEVSHEEAARRGNEMFKNFKPGEKNCASQEATAGVK
ncbi:MAG: VOC family protein [Limisphaerales bacterium]